jgi:hypothetical protein
MEFSSKIRKNYDRKEPKYDYLKYYRVVRYWVKAKYGLGTSDLDMISFLYTQKLFSRAEFKEYECIFTWDVNRFQRLLKEGWISVWRERKGTEGALYEVSHKGKLLMVSVYKKLNGEEPISEAQQNNPLFNTNVSYTDNMYKRVIKTMNRNYAERRRLKKIEEIAYQKQPHVIQKRASRGLPPHPFLEL